jgi:hypothetical protein
VKIDVREVVAEANNPRERKEDPFRARAAAHARRVNEVAERERACATMHGIMVTVPGTKLYQHRRVYAHPARALQAALEFSRHAINRDVRFRVPSIDAECRNGAVEWDFR